VIGNTIGTPTVADSGGAAGIWVSAEGWATETLAITGNHLYQYSNDAGIAFLDQGRVILNLTITGNTIADPGPNAFVGIAGQAGEVDTNDAGTVCAAITGNSIAGSSRAGRADVGLSQNDGTTIELPGYTGPAGDTSAVESFLIGNNDASGTPTALATVSGNGGGFADASGC
jgi:hypothetical protein